MARRRPQAREMSRPAHPKFRKAPESDSRGAERSLRQEARPRPRRRPQSAQEHLLPVSAARPVTTRIHRPGALIKRKLVGSQSQRRQLRPSVVAHSAAHAQATQGIQLPTSADNSARVLLLESNSYGRLKLADAPGQKLSSITASTFHVDLDLGPGFLDQPIALAS